MKQSNKQSGQVLILAVILFVVASVAVIGGFISPVVRTAQNTNNLVAGDRSYFLSESGAEDVAYRLKNVVPVSASETLTLLGQSVTTNTTDVGGGKELVSIADYSNHWRKVKTLLSLASGASFSLGMQVGGGGLSSGSNVNLTGSLYSNGPITSTGNFRVSGDAVSASSTGLINNVDVGGNAYAHSITNSAITGHGYYATNKTGSTAGTWHAGSADQPAIPLPITEATIDSWEAQAAANVTNCSGTLNLSGTMTIGPRKYTCNVTVNANSNITLAGPIWVAGTFQNTANLNVFISSSQSGKTIPIIADNPANRTTSSQIIIGANFDASGYGANSYVMLLSRNNSAELSGSEKAINITANVNNGNNLILYAGHGLVTIGGNTDVNQLTGYKVSITSNFGLTYQLGLASLIFTSGPGGAWDINSWSEIE